jgi:regulator of replication initiation timing
MPVEISRKATLLFGIIFALILTIPPPSAAQQPPRLAAVESATAPAPARPSDDLQTLASLIRDLQNQIHDLNTQVNDLRVAERASKSETAQLRAELGVLKTQLNAHTPESQMHAVKTSYSLAETNTQPSNPAQPLAGTAAVYDTPSQPLAITNTEISSSSSSTVREFPSLPAAQPIQDASNPQNPANLQDRLSNLEEQLQLVHQEIAEQSQTKVESGSKYRLRLSGIILVNLFDNRGSVDNLDYPAIAVPPESGYSNSAFSGSLRQSQIALQAFGPDIAGAHTSADVRIDFGGGFPASSNGTNMGIVRLRTGVVRLDWSNTSIIAGQDQLFFAPTNPTSLASLAVPPLAYAGNLWAWAPQVRIEHRFDLSDGSRLLLQGGILESLSGEIVEPEESEGGYDRLPTQGEQSGQPAYAGRIAWSHHLFGQQMIAGVGGYFGRQNWGFNRNINAWTTTADLTVPLGNLFQFSGEFYRGNATGGLGGGIGQSVVWNGNIYDAGTVVHGLDSAGGWVQLKFRPNPKFEINGALGDDNPFASELQAYQGNPSYLGFLITRNFSPFVNFIYEPRANVVFSTEYRRLKTFILANDPQTANLVTLTVGYIF